MLSSILKARAPIVACLAASAGLAAHATTPGPTPSLEAKHRLVDDLFSR